MKKYDARKLPRDVQQHNRDQAIRLYKQGESRKRISEIVVVHYGTICKWIRKWESGGDSAIQLQKRGRGSKDQRLLNPKQEEVLKKLLIDKNPEQLKLPFSLWNREAIHSVIYQMWRIRIAIRTIGDYMKRWGFTPQKPIKRAYEQSPKAVEQWLKETYPEIKNEHKKKGQRFTGVMRPAYEMIVNTREGMPQKVRHLLLM